MKLLYQEIRQQIEGNSSAEHVRLWNNQVNLWDKGEQIPFQMPAVFIDFPQLEWSQIGKGKQNSQLLTRLYIVFESFITAENEEDLDVFDLRDEVYLAVQDFKPTQSGKLQRVAESTDPNHTNLYVWTMDFRSTYTDIVAEFPRTPTTGEITTLTITPDLEIDATTYDGIRTSNEIT